LAIYEAVRYFRRILEARHFTILTDHNLLTSSFQKKRDKYSPTNFKHLDYISQFMTDIRHISGQENIVAEALSRVEAIAAPVTHDSFTETQDGGAELRILLESNTAVLL
jgi:hypothetical protein